MSFDIKVAIKKPWVKYGLIAVAFVGVFYILYSRESGGSAATTSAGGESDADYAADTQLAAQQNATAAAAQQQAAQNSFQLDALKEQDSTQLAGQAASIAGTLSLADKTNATNITLGNIQLSGLQAQLNEQAHVSDNNTAATVNNANQAAGAAKTASNNGTIAAVASTVALAAIAFF